MLSSNKSYSYGYTVVTMTIGNAYKVALLAKAQMIY